MRSLLFCVICVICGPVVSASSASQDWPAFRGPGGQGHATDISVQREWSEALNVAWKTAVRGLGWSSPVVAGGKVWLTTAVEQRGISLRLLGFDAATGQELVNVEVFKVVAMRGEINPKNRTIDRISGLNC